MVGNNAWQKYAKGFIEDDHPNLAESRYRITSQDTIEYNCVAWAAEDQESWWWPDSENQMYWPPNVPRIESIEAFIQAFETLSYKVSEINDTSVENGYQKIAIYCLHSRPTHVARQLNNGNWTSKIGDWEDIEHNKLEGLEDDKYGKVACIMKRGYVK